LIKNFIYKLKKIKNKLLSIINLDLFSLASSPCLDNTWDTRTKNTISYLMLSHDRDIDRRIIQQAKTLNEHGWQGILICFSDSDKDIFEHIDGLPCQRISQKRILQDTSLCRLKVRLNLICEELPASDWLLLLNKVVFKAILGLIYRSRFLNHPLPYDLPFYGAARHYKADLVQAHDLPALATAVRLGQEWKSPVVYDAHEYYPEQKIFSNSQKKIMNKIEQENITKCSAFFSVNEELGMIMAKRYGCSSFYELFNAVDAPVRLTREAKLFHKHFRIPLESPLILYQGGLAINRNLELLVEAMSLIKHPSAVLIFLGNGAYGHQLASIARKKGCDKRVLFKNAVPQSDLLSWTTCADIGLIPYEAVDLNTTYCNPNKMFEYIQAELPILANDLPSLKRFVEKTHFGKIVPMKEPKCLAIALDQILADREFLEKTRLIIAAGKEYFSWRRQSNNYWNIINSLVYIFKDNKIKKI
jgi:glycosyltransferase involved in cell wall biosynthesis